MLHTDCDYILTFCSRVVIGLANYYLKGKGFQGLHTFIPGSMVNELEGHPACAYGLEAEDFPAACACHWRPTFIRWLELRFTHLLKDRLLVFSYLPPGNLSNFFLPL
jgi:hypothetical protein